MTHVTCLDREHTVPLSVQLSLVDGAGRASTILGLSHCPACPDVHLTPAALDGLQSCPCCLTVWWTDGGMVRCTAVNTEGRAAAC